MRAGRTLVTISAASVDCSPAAPLRFRRHLPGEVGQSDADRLLTGSVKRFGVIHPPILAVDPGREISTAVVVDGYRRLAAARAAGLDALEVLLAPAEPMKDGGIIALRVETVPWGRPPSELELIVLAGRVAKPGTDPTGLLRAAFGKRLSSGFLARLLSLLDLDDEVLEALHRGAVSTGDLLLLGGERHIDTAETVRILASEKLNRREQKEAVRLMVRLADLRGDEWRTFLERRGTGASGLLGTLRALCYPTLTGDLERIGTIADSMQLPPGAAVHPPENMEGGHYRLELRFRRAEEFERIVEKLRRAASDGKIDELVGILRGERTGGGSGEKEKGAHRVGCSRSRNLEL